jgi:hypothetical protein
LADPAHPVRRLPGSSSAALLDDQLVDIGGVCSIARLHLEIIEDQQIDAQQLSHLGIVAVVEPGGRLETLEELIGTLEVYDVATPDRGVAQSDCRSVPFDANSASARRGSCESV